MTSEAAQHAAAPAAAARARRALASRLRVVAAVVMGADAQPPVGEDPAADAAAVLEAIVDSLRLAPTRELIWLTLTAISAAFPTMQDVQDAQRRLELGTTLDSSLALLDTGLERATRLGEPLAEIELIIGGVVVDVDHTARFNLHTGIQRVVRNLLPHWQSRDVLPVIWTPRGGGLRRLTGRETERVLDWDARGDAGEGPTGGDERPRIDRLVVPWRSVFVMAEVPAVKVSDRIAAIGATSGNRVAGIGYDGIPVVSADLVPPVEASKFVRYLTAVKFSHRIAGISTAATAELSGFVAMLPTQGLIGPTVTEVILPDPPTPDLASGNRPSPPLVLVVGSHEPRKNHLAVLHAAELLWREGHRFRLRFIGGSGWGEEFPRRAADLIAAGRPVEVLRAVADETLNRSLDDAAFTVFPSLHEGYGLPIVESFAHGTPVITSDFGSTAEITAAGGALSIDPRSDSDLTEAMRQLLTDRELLAELRRQISRRRGRSWSDYADQLWHELIAPELDGLAVRDREGETGVHR